MRQAHQLSALILENSLEKRSKRKLSLRQQHCTSNEDLLCSEGFRTLGDYIQSNIQSKRKNIMQLYSTTLSFLDQSQNNSYPQDLLSPNLRKWSRKKSNKEFLSPLTPHLKQKHSNQSSDQPDNSMIVSNKFPQKIVRKPKIFLERLGRLSPRKVMPNQGKTTDQKEKKQEKPASKLKVLPAVVQSRSKSIKKRKTQSRQNIVNQINPWQYLVIPQDPYYFNL